MIPEVSSEGANAAEDTPRADVEWPEQDMGLPELPPNRPLGFLGETPPDFRKVDLFEPDGLNAGLIQESTPETRWLTIVLLYLMVVTIPVAAVVLWRSQTISRRGKVIVTVVGLVGILGVVIAVRV